MVRAIATVAAVICSILAAAGCGGSGRHHTTTPPTTSSGCCDASPTGAQIQLARSSSPLFSIFPAAPGETACVIPAGLGRLRGTCRTSVRPARTHEPAFIVSFTETWMSRVGKCSPFCPVPFRLYHTWTILEGEPVVTTGSRLHVYATHSRGARAPQFND